MNHKIDIEETDSNGLYHGYQEWYDYFGNLSLRLIMKHGNEIGYEEWHNENETNFYIR